MAKIAINPAQQSAAPSNQLAQAEAPVSQELTVAMPGQFEGEFTSRDFAIPSLVICQKSGKLMDDNPS